MCKSQSHDSHSTFRYGSPGTPSSMIRTSAGLPKTQNSSPTPANPQVWPMRQQSQTEGYQAYNQLSPSRSPSGPTYTQLSSGINARTAYHTATSAQQQGPQPGEMIIWVICWSLTDLIITIQATMAGLIQATAQRHHPRTTTRFLRPVNIPSKVKSSLTCCKCSAIRVDRPPLRTSTSTCSLDNLNSKFPNDTRHKRILV